ncbi:MAG: hypothetical protein GY737_27805 [Desulfobacteraceae bacterium]|nr:hypothetical protein [Desulfobacteraceae bacterium]
MLLGGKELDEVSIAIHGGGCAAVNLNITGIIRCMLIVKLTSKGKIKTCLGS